MDGPRAPVGVTAPGLDLGPLPAEASSGGSLAISINGRLIHDLEIAWLYATYGQAIPGSYWLDAHGNLGLEGNPQPFANLYATSASSGGGSGSSSGGTYSWAGGTAGVIDGAAFVCSGAGDCSSWSRCWNGPVHPPLSS